MQILIYKLMHRYEPMLSPKLKANIRRVNDSFYAITIPKALIDAEIFKTDVEYNVTLTPVKKEVLDEKVVVA